MEVQRISIFANLLTLGNGICGFAALSLILRAQIAPAAEPVSAEALAPFATASWLILLGMVMLGGVLADVLLIVYLRCRPPHRTRLAARIRQRPWTWKEAGTIILTLIALHGSLLLAVAVRLHRARRASR